MVDVAVATQFNDLNTLHDVNPLRHSRVSAVVYVAVFQSGTPVPVVVEVIKLDVKESSPTVALSDHPAVLWHPGVRVHLVAIDPA